MASLLEQLHPFPQWLFLGEQELTRAQSNLLTAKDALAAAIANVHRPAIAGEQSSAKCDKAAVLDHHVIAAKVARNNAEIIVSAARAECQRRRDAYNVLRQEQACEEAEAKRAHERWFQEKYEARLRDEERSCVRASVSSSTAVPRGQWSSRPRNTPTLEQIRSACREVQAG